MKSISLHKQKELRIVGIMNGTSLDGIDYILVSIKRSGKALSAKYISSASSSFSSSLQSELKAAANHQMNVKDLAMLHHKLGKQYAEDLAKIKKSKKWKFDLIGLHGQTVFHSGAEATLQIGEPSYLSAEFSVPVVSDFRAGDIAYGGQGAPIASFFHKEVFSKLFKGKRISLHNIGGISNLTLLNPKGDVELAFDTGPGNMLLDLSIQQISKNKIQFDNGGELAKQGVPDEKIVDHLLKDKFLSKNPPKSCGREEFGIQFLQQHKSVLSALSEKDLLATLTEFTARSMALAYTQFAKKLPAAIILCGGGAKNTYLKQRMQYHLPKIQVLDTEELGWPLQSIEGAAFAMLAACRIWGISNNLPKTTGAKKSIVMGKLTDLKSL